MSPADITAALDRAEALLVELEAALQRIREAQDRALAFLSDAGGVPCPK